MHRQNFWILAAIAGLFLGNLITSAPPTVEGRISPFPSADEAATDERASKPDSYYYYGPNGLWKYWHDPNNPKAPSERLGRDTWIHWTWGNQKFLRKAAVLAGRLPVPISLDFFRVLDSRNRATRFRDLGVINEPNCEQNNQPDEYGLYLDTWKGDPLKYYPGDAAYRQQYASSYPVPSRRSTSGTTESRRASLACVFSPIRSSMLQPKPIGVLPSISRIRRS